jgi:hypothetical protein
MRPMTSVSPLLALATASAMTLGTLHAQDTTTARQTVQLAFGFECGDRFLVRNDGSEPVDLEYRAAGSQNRSELHLDAKQSSEIASASSDPLELWVYGKLVATEPKGTRVCGQRGGGPSVVVRPIDSAPRSADIPPSRVARLSSLGGTVSFEPSGSTNWSAATLNYTITTGDRLVADLNGRAELEVGPFVARLGGGTDVTIANLTDGLMQLALQQGAMRLAVYRLTPGDTIEVDTPNGALTVLAPGAYRIESSPGGVTTVVSVDGGRLEVTGPGVTQLVEAGRAVRLSGTDPIQLSSIPQPAPTSLDQWSADRERRLTGAASAVYVNRDLPGRADLDEYGRWEVDVVNGPTWYPTVVEVGWVPYRYGHWAWVEPWGWVWVEREPWGFAPFHYGRWAHGPRGWGWVPGPIVARPYYAPALVAFVDAPAGGFGVSFGVQAWFPLGPREPFFPWYHHDERYLREVNITNINVTNINTVIHVTNVENVQYAHRRTAVTAVPVSSFAAGKPVAPDAIPVNVDRMDRMRIIAHPTTAPTVQAAAGGSPVARPPNVVERRPSGAGAMVRPVLPAPSPPASGPPAAGSKAGGAPPPTGARAGVAPAMKSPAAGAEQSAPRPLVVKRPMPPENLPFEVRQKALSEHPGRPLDPRQIRNLRAGKAAGPPVDSEVPPHLKKPPERKARPPQS